MSCEENAEDKYTCSSVSCSLSKDELKLKRDSLIPGLFDKADEVLETNNGFCFHLKRREGVLSEMVNLIEEESFCCSFLEYVLSVKRESVFLEVSGPPGSKELLKSL